MGGTGVGHASPPTRGRRRRNQGPSLERALARLGCRPSSGTSAPFSSLRESVLDLLASLLEVALRLVALALGSESLVTADLASRLLELALRLLAVFFALSVVAMVWFLV
jgi:hypothetical protein